MKKNINSINLLLVFALVLLFSIASAANCFASVSTTPSLSPTPTPTPAAEIKEYKICGYVRSELTADFKDYCVKIPEIGLSAKTGPSGYYEITGVPEMKSGTPYTLIISKPGYLTRTVKNLWVDTDIEVGSSNEPVSIISGDVNDDGAINMSDIFVLANVFNTLDSDAKFNAPADLNSDGAVNMSDVMIIAVNFNKSSSGYAAPSVAGLNYFNLQINDYMNITLREGTIAGITWNYTMSDDSIVRFISKTTVFEQPVPDGAADRMWTFRAISKGYAVIVFKPSHGDRSQKYLVSVTDGATVSPIPSALPDSEPELVDSKSLKSTLITTNSDQKIEPGKNLVYCPTFQMAWDELKTVIGGNIKLSGEPPLATTLNNGFPMSGSLSPESYISMAGYGQETINKINSALKNKFGESAPQVNELIGPYDIIAYSYLSKNINFAKSFEVMSTPLNFWSNGIAADVKNFGINQLSKKYNELAGQVKIYDYKSRNDFIVKLLPENDLDEIILAKIPPKESLYKTYASVMNRIDTTAPVGYDNRDYLKIPVLDFNIGHNYTELEGKSLLNPGFENYFIQKAYQRTRFNLDENGAVLASEATIIVPYSIYEPKELVFDGPFMIILKEKNAVNPYLMIWVDNSELLSK